MLGILGKTRGTLIGVATVLALACAPAASATSIRESDLHAGSDPRGVTAGPDGNVWFTDEGTINAVGKITPAGAVTEFTKGLNPGARPVDITLGSDGNLWFTDQGSPAAIGQVTPNGLITEFDLPSGSSPSGLVSTPDGNLWFLDIGTSKAVGRITTSGTIKEFPKGLLAGSSPDAITVGSDGNVWFTDRGSSPAIGRVKPDGTIDEFSKNLLMGSMPNGITGGPDGNVWFTDDNASAVGKITPDGAITEFTANLHSGAIPDTITSGPDGNVWFNDQNSGHRAVGRVTPQGTITEFDTGLDQTRFQNTITAAPDGNLWIEQATPDGVQPGAVARITPSGQITEFTTGMNPGSGADGDQLTVGPDGNLWFNDRGSRAIGRIALELAPRVITGAAIKITRTGATVSGSVNPLGSAASVRVQYGTTNSLRSSVSGGTLPASGDTHAVSVRLTNLPPGTVIHYRVVASNAFGTIRGATRTFKTAGMAVTVTRVRFDDQQIVLTTPSPLSCTSKRLTATLASARIRRSRALRLRFVAARFYVDGRLERTVHHVPVSLKLSLNGLAATTHRLRVVLAYRTTATPHRLKTKRLTVKFRTC